MNNADSHIEARQASVQLTPRDLEEFEALFLEWRDKYPNFEELELGGLGDQLSLAQRALRWAAGVLERSGRQPVNSW